MTLKKPLEPEALSPERRERIIAGAALVFIQDGYEGASMSQIASAANVSKGTLYNYFPSKQALFAAFVRDKCNRLVQEVFGDGPANLSIEEELARISRTMLKMMLSPLGLAMYRVVVMEAVKFPELAQAFMASGPSVTVGRMSEWISQKILAGELRADDPVFAAEQFFALSQTRLALRARVTPSLIVSEAEIEQVVKGSVSVFMAAYHNPGFYRVASGS